MFDSASIVVYLGPLLINLCANGVSLIIYLIPAITSIVLVISVISPLIPAIPLIHSLVEGTVLIAAASLKTLLILLDFDISSQRADLISIVGIVVLVVSLISPLIPAITLILSLVEGAVLIVTTLLRDLVGLLELFAKGWRWNRSISGRRTLQRSGSTCKRCSTSQEEHNHH